MDADGAQRGRERWTDGKRLHELTSSPLFTLKLHFFQLCLLDGLEKRQKADKETPLLYGTDHIELANKTYHYRYPLHLPMPAHKEKPGDDKKKQNNPARLLMGVSSAAWNTEHRQGALCWKMGSFHRSDDLKLLGGLLSAM